MTFAAIFSKCSIKLHEKTRKKSYIICCGSGTSTPSAYDQHKDDTGNNEDLSIEEQHTEPRPDQANEAEEQLLNTMNIHGPALRKAYIVLYLKEEG